MAAQTGSSSAPTTPSVSGTSMIVTPARFLTRMRRAFPSSTSFLMRSMTRSTPSSSTWNVSNTDSFVVGISCLLFGDDLKCLTGFPGGSAPSTVRARRGFRCLRDTQLMCGSRIGERQETHALRGHRVHVPPSDRRYGLDEQSRGTAFPNDLPERTDEPIDEHCAEVPLDPW